MRSSKISKKNIRSAFSRAASTYDLHADIQKEVNKLLMGKLPQHCFKDILEIGCGTGSLTKSMMASLPKPLRIFAVDLSHNMLLTARRGILCNNDIFFVCCDAESLPFNNNQRFDLIISASAMQWFNHFGPSIEKLAQKHLKKGGLFLAAFFGTKSLQELSVAISMEFPARDASLPTACFPSFPQDVDRLAHLFNKFKVERLIIEKHYPDLLHLLRVFKMTGVSPRRNRRALLSSKDALARLQRCYVERFGAIKASFEIILISAIGK